MVIASCGLPGRRGPAKTGAEAAKYAGWQAQKRQK
jgi:hypothetical protein